MKTIAVLAVQGAFIEHEKILQDLGAKTFEIRQKSDLLKEFDGLILPGGESTVMGKLLKELDLFDILKEKIEGGMPVLATCAGLILLAGHIAKENKVHFGTMPITVIRNAYGRQLGSFDTVASVKNVGVVPLRFIRAPLIESVEDGVDVLAVVDSKIVGVKYKNQIGLAFHPELTRDNSIHEYFLGLV